MQNFRPAAVPLINVDPFFSVWSMADHLYDDFTRHWTGRRQAMTGLIEIDGKLFRFMGKTGLNPKLYTSEPAPMEQISVKANAVTTDYVFQSNGIRLNLTFTTPLFMDDLKLMSRPCCFVSFHLSSADGRAHKAKLWFDISGEHVINEDDANVVLSHSENDVYKELTIGSEEQNVLGRQGDGVCIDWGYLHLIAGHNGGFAPFTWNDDARYDRFRWTKEDIKTRGFLHWYNYHDGKYEYGKPYKFDETFPMLGAYADASVSAGGEKTLKLCLMYDDIKSINYFGTHLDAYWKKDGETFEDIAKDSVINFDRYMERARAFDKQLYADAYKSGGEKYADLLSLVYRQAVNAHKLAAGENGEALFFSKECNSNGCIATVDVSYPSMPIFALYNPELIFGMMRPIMAYANSGAWPHPFAPHDVGTYPNATGQVYSGTSLQGQMPVEECGNMLLMTAVATVASGDFSFFRQHYDTLNGWCEYLIENAQDPANQLCTDDFTGHLAHNANLSIKGINAIAAFGRLCGMLGDTAKQDLLTAKAREMAAVWKNLARDASGHYRLAYDQPGTWSLKYNIVWDQIFGMDIFDKDIYKAESDLYQTKLNRYGVPLDSRDSFTKVDFLMWAAIIGGNQAHFDSICESVWNMSTETTTQYPLTDWYDTITAKRCYFINRSVVGGLFIKLLEDSKKLLLF